MDAKTSALLYAVLSTFSLIAVCFLAYIKVLPPEIVYVLIGGLVAHGAGTVATAIQFERPVDASTPFVLAPTPDSPAPQSQAPQTQVQQSRVPQTRVPQTQVPQTQVPQNGRDFTYPPTPSQQWSNAALAQYNRQIVANQATTQMPSQPQNILPFPPKVGS